MATAEIITDPATALDRCADLFSDDPVTCNMVAATLRPPDPVELIRTSEGGRTVGAAIRWGDGYTLSALASGAVDAIANALPVTRRFELFGPTGTAADVAGAWSQRCNGTLRPIEMMRVYRLGTLRPPSDVEGRLAQADAAHIALGAEWSIAFSEEIDHGTSTTEAARAQIGRAIDQGRLFTWMVGDEPVAQLLVAVERFDVVRLGGVYTPPDHRGRGHAAALTASVSAGQLERSAVTTVTLNTQATNAATNRLYRRLGFEAHHEVMTIDLNPGDLNPGDLQPGAPVSDDGG